MADFDEEPLGDLEAQLQREDPRFARALDSARPCPPREYRYRPVWLLLAAAYAVLWTGLVTEHALLIVAGVTLAAAGGRLYDHRRAHARGHDDPRW